jgi:outer membrane protein assembly factor BamB
MMKATTRVAILLILSAAPVLAAPTGYSVRSNVDDHLYAIDLATGVAVDLGLIDFDDAEGLAFAGTQLYAIGGTEGEFWNITTPPGVLVGATGPRSGIDAGLDFDVTQNKMYNINTGGGETSTLYEINIANGAATFVGSDTVFADGLAIDANGSAFAADFLFSDSLYSVNLTNGDLTLVGLLGIDVSVQDGLAFDPAGILYALTSDGEIYTLNTGSGQATFLAQVTLGGDEIGGFEGLAIQVPEPSSLLLATLGLSCLAALGWRRGRAH